MVPGCRGSLICPFWLPAIELNVRIMAVSLTRDFQAAPRWVDANSPDTFENARTSAIMLRAANVNSILLVTSSNHMVRSMREFSATGLEVTAAPVQILATRELGPFRYLPSVEGLLRSNRAIYELIGEPVRRILVALNLRRQQRGGSAKPEAGNTPAHHDVIERPDAEVFASRAGRDHQR